MSIFGNMMNNYFYGKAGKGDYTVEKMPQNRRQLFGEVWKVRWSSLFGVNLLYVLFWIPAFMWTFINVVTLFTMLGSETPAPASELYGLILTYLVILFPCIAITGPFKAGVTYVLRNWARDEHSFVFSDFKDAVKANWKQGLAISTINGIMPCMVFMCWYFYGSMLNQSGFFIVPIALISIIALLWSLCYMNIYMMMVTYELPLKGLIRNSLLMTMAKLPFALLIKLLTLLVPILGLALSILIPSIQMYVLLIVVMLYIFYMPAFNGLITASYSNWLCETYLNTKIEGAATGIGLRPEDWDDVEYLPEDDE